MTTSKLNISPEWTSDERLRVVGQIAMKMRRGEIHLSLREMLDLRERIVLLVSSSAQFLEFNRAGILEGLEDEQ